MPSLEQRLETKKEFCERVYKNWDKLHLDEKPYDANVELVEKTWDIAGEGSNDFKARVLCYWFHDNFEYAREAPYGSASEAFKSMRGTCVNSAFLYTTMAKIAGLNSCFVLVTKDEEGKLIDHACSGVSLDGRLVLVDPSSSCFDLKYREFRVVDDERAVECYNNHFLRHNRKDFNGVKIFVEQVVRKKFPLYVDYDSKYGKCDPKYIEFLVQQMKKKDEEGNFDKKTGWNIAAAPYSVLLGFGRAFLIPGIFLFGVGLGTKYPGSLQPIGHRLDELGDFFHGVSLSRENMEEKIEKLRPFIFDEMVENLREVYKDDPRLDLKYSEENYLSIGKMYLKCLKGKL